MYKRARVLDVEIDRYTFDETMKKIGQFIKQGKPRKIFTYNVALHVWARDKPELKKIYRTCDILPCDGVGMYYASKILGDPVPEVVNGSDLFFRLLEVGPKKGYRVFLLGTKDEILERAVANAKEQYPGIKIVGWHNGFFSLREEPAVAEMIRKAKPDLLFLAMSSPKKEEFIERNIKTMNVPVTIGVGGSVDILAGVYTRAPLWMQKAGLEWFYRFIQEPRRMWKRVIVTSSVFIFLVMKEYMRKKFR